MLISYHHIIKSYLFITQMLQNILESPASEGTETTQTNSGIDNFATPFARCKGDTGQFLDNISSGDQSKDPLILDNCKDKSGGQSPACKKMVPSPSSSGVVTTPKSQGVPYPSEGDATATSASHQSDRLMRKWEIFPGRNKFLCDGRCIMAVNTGIFYFTISLIVITVSLFFAFECRLTLVSEISFGFFIPIGCGVLFLFNLACLLRTAWSDPGIIPRATPEESAYMEKMLQDSVPKDEGLGGYRPPPRTQEVTVNGVTIKLKYCFTCKIFRPPRASHCSLCDNCVENFDHHCPWVGNCVGRRNYRYFFLFVTSLSILCIYIFVFSVVHIVLLSKRENGFLNALKLSPGSVLEVLICFFSVWSVVGLSGFHSYLIATGLTTNEDIKGTWSKKRNRSNVNPFDRGGWVQNCMYQLCTPVPVSSINRRARVTPEELARRETQLQRQTSMNGANRTYGTASMSPSKPGTSSFAPGADRETYDSSQALYPRQPNYPTTPSQQFPASAPPSTNSLSHQQQQPEVSAGTTAGESTSATPESNQTTAAVTITHYPIVNNTSVVHASYNRNNSTTTSPHALDVDIEQPDVIVEHLPHLLDASVLSTDSRTLLLKDNPPGVTGSESPTPPQPAAANPAKSGKISSV